MNFIFLLAIIISISNATVIDLTNNNIKSVLESNDLVLIDFYASWCYFSNILDPIFSDASNLLDSEYKDQGKVVLGKVDCEKQGDLSKQYGIRKYPTIKLFRFGEVSKHEYRGARSGSAFVEYIKNQLVDPIIYLNSTEAIKKEIGNSYIIAHLKEKAGVNFQIFRKIAYQLNDECKFVLQINPEITAEKLVYESTEKPGSELLQLDNPDEVKQWIVRTCTPVVRNITFQNAEDITEEGLPLVLLFYSPSKPEITTRYSKFVADHLMAEKKTVNFVYADGQKFAHPLTHLGKSEQDLPLFVIDSFQHMFMLSEPIESTLSDPAILKRYVGDLHSGKLHREFHNGPDPVVTNQDQPQQVGGDSQQQATTPLPSVFKKLRPNSNRYTLFHDEF